MLVHQVELNSLNPRMRFVAFTLCEMVAETIDVICELSLCQSEGFCCLVVFFCHGGKILQRTLNVRPPRERRVYEKKQKSF